MCIFSQNIIANYLLKSDGVENGDPVDVKCLLVEMVSKCKKKLLKDHLFWVAREKKLTQIIGLWILNGLKQFKYWDRDKKKRCISTRERIRKGHRTKCRACGAWLHERPW